MVWVLNSLKEENPVDYYKQKMKYNLYNFNQYNLIIDFFNQKLKEIELCDIDNLYKDEFKNSIDILKMNANIIIAYQDEVDVQFRIEKLKDADQSIDKIILDLKKCWLVRNKSSRLSMSIENLLKVQKFIKLSIEYLKGGKHGAQN